MKPILATLIILTAISLKAGADLYTSPGNVSNPGYPNYPYPGQPHEPPPYPPPYQSYTSCKVEYTGNYYYVSKNGQRFTDLTSSLQQAISQQQQLVNSGMCEYSSQSPGLCQLEYTGNYYYISRNGNRLSDLVSDYHAALSTRDLLLQSRNCEQSNYAPNALCKVEYTGNYYYISINNQRSTDLTADLNSLLNQQRMLSERGMCAQPQPERCTVEYTGNYYYVARNSNRISDLMSNISQASDLQQRLRYSNNCY